MWKRSSSWTDSCPLSSSTPDHGLRGFGSQEQLQRHRGSLEILRGRSNSVSRYFFLCLFSVLFVILFEILLNDLNSEKSAQQHK